MRLIDADALLIEFDEYEPCEELYESEFALWLDLRMAVINAETVGGRDDG